MAMTVTTTGVNKPKRLKGQNYVEVLFTLTASGSYATNGDTLSLKGLNHISARIPDFVRISGVSGFFYEYDKATEKLIVRGMEPTLGTAGVVGLSQIAAAAYPAAVTGDTITGIAIWALK